MVRIAITRINSIKVKAFEFALLARRVISDSDFINQDFIFVARPSCRPVHWRLAFPSSLYRRSWGYVYPDTRKCKDCPRGHSGCSRDKVRASPLHLAAAGANPSTRSCLGDNV